MRLRATTFRPPWWATLLTLVFCLSFIRLGIWQLDRAQEKQQLLAAWEHQHALPPLTLEDFPDKAEVQQYESVSLAGSFDNAHTFLLDNQPHEGQVGYHVFTPFQIEAGGPAILVNRGWVAADADRNRLPQVPAIENSQIITGYLYKPTGSLLVLDESQALDTGWPKRVQALEPNQLAPLLTYPLVDYTLRLRPEKNSGFIRDWQMKHLTPEKHWGYAFQWFALAVTLLIIYLIVNRPRRKKTDERSG